MPDEREDPVKAGLEKFLAAFPKGPVKSEIVTISKALHRVLSKEVRSPVDSPPYSRSIIEGYAVNAQDTLSASQDRPVILNRIGEIRPGATRIKGIESGTAFQVATGSLIPSSACGIVRYFDCELKEGKLSVKKPVQPGENIELQGCELKKGAALLPKGKLLTPADIGLLASVGISKVPVSVRPKVAIYSSGNEVIPLSRKMTPGNIWDCNAHSLAAAVAESGGIPHFKGIIKDDFNLFKKELKKGLKAADMILISGGTAVEGRDFVADLIQSLGKPGTINNGIPMRSGKPMVHGVVGRKPLVCVAGHPPEALRGFTLFGKPALNQLMGRSDG